MSYPSSSTPSSYQKIIEHLVLLKMKPNSSATDSAINNLNGLKLDTVLHISCGAIACTRSSPIPFTHLVHGRYVSIEALNEYSAHPSHVSIAEEFAPICDDFMVVDWESAISGPIEMLPGKGMRINLVKLKEGVGESEKNEILGVMGGIHEKFGEIEDVSYGENFSPRAKGFSIGSIVVVPGLEELKGLDSEGEEKEKVRGFIESAIVLDYLVPDV